MEISNHGSVKKVADRITRHSCSSKGVNNQMEATDRLKQSGGDGKNTTKTQKLMIIIHNGYLPKVGSFFNELELWWNICSLLGLIFNELELRIKLLVIRVSDTRFTVNTMFF